MRAMRATSENLVEHVTEDEVREWIEWSGLGFCWKTPPREAEFNGPTEFEGDSGTFIRECAYMATQPTLENNREEFMVEVLCTYFRTWPMLRDSSEPIRDVQDRFIVKAKAIKDLLQWESLDRTFVVPTTPWRTWVKWHPSMILSLSRLIRWQHAVYMCAKIPPAYPFDRGEDASSEEDYDMDDSEEEDLMSEGDNHSGTDGNDGGDASASDSDEGIIPIPSYLRKKNMTL